MRKTLIALVILILSFGVVGCTSDKDETTTNNSEVVTQEETKENDKRSSDEMYELYASKVEDVEKFFKENNINFEVKDSRKNTKYDEKVSLSYEDSSNNNIGEFSVANYGVSFEENGDIRYISSRMSLNVNDDEMKTKEFKFEDTEFSNLKNILIPEINNIDEINKKVNEGYKNLTSTKTIELKNGNIKESFILGNNMLAYTVVIYP